MAFEIINLYTYLFISTIYLHQKKFIGYHVAQYVALLVRFSTESVHATQILL